MEIHAYIHTYIHIAEFTSSICHVKGTSNVVADALSRPSASSVAAVSSSPPLLSSIATLPGLDLDGLARCQVSCKEEMDAYYDGSSLQLQVVTLPSGSPLLCDMTLVAPRPVVPRTWIPRVFACVHGLAHQGSNATLADTRRRFVWNQMSSDIRRLCHSCQFGQGSSYNDRRLVRGECQAPRSRSLGRASGRAVWILSVRSDHERGGLVGIQQGPF